MKMKRGKIDSTCMNFIEHDAGGNFGNLSFSFSRDFPMDENSKSQSLKRFF